MNKTYTELLQVAAGAARAAGERMCEGWGKPHAVELKGVTNLVTEVDRAAETMILAHLHAATPEYDILAEESGEHLRGAPFCWVIDPLDGTTNYAHHFPYFAVSIGLEEKGESVAGVVYDPVLDQMFTATRGGGAYLNGEPIQCSASASLGESLVAAGLVYEVWDSDRGIGEIMQLIKRVRSLRIVGSASLDIANVACGRLDAYCDTGLFPWDVSAARLILQEAGGRFALYGDGADIGDKYCIASNGRIHAELARLLVGAS